MSGYAEWWHLYFLIPDNLVSYTGQVIAVNSVRLSIDNADRLSQVRVTEDMADETLCSSKGVGNAFFTFIRVYYVCGPPQPTQIGESGGV